MMVARVTGIVDDDDDAGVGAVCPGQFKLRQLLRHDLLVNSTELRKARNVFALYYREIMGGVELGLEVCGVCSREKRERDRAGKGREGGGRHEVSARYTDFT
jgi:hypothetical protein